MKKNVRYAFVDIIKSIGIFEFIIWHILTNFYYFPPSSSFLQRLVFSVTGYFVFSSGFLIGGYYYGKNGNINGWLFLFRRLCVRVIKLLAIMSLAGFVISYMHTWNIIASVQISMLKIFSLFYVDRWDVPLQVLFAISITLIIGPLLFKLFLSNKYVRTLYIIVVIIIITYDFASVENFPYLWRYFAQGLIGIYVGFLFTKYVFSKTINNSSLILFALLCFSCFLCIETAVAFSPILYNYFLLNITAQAFSVVTFFCGFGLLSYIAFDVDGRDVPSIIKPFALLGKHSLFVYLLQISIIDLFVILCNGAKFTSQIEGLCYSVVLLIVCIVVCYFVEFLMRYHIFNYFYKFVFR